MSKIPDQNKFLEHIEPWYIYFCTENDMMLFLVNDQKSIKILIS